MNGKITTQRSMSGSGSTPTAADLRRFLEGVADTTRVTLSVSRPDPRDQRDSGSWSLSASIEEATR